MKNPNPKLKKKSEPDIDDRDDEESSDENGQESAGLHQEVCSSIPMIRFVFLSPLL
jgi:hypothetical protein